MKFYIFTRYAVYSSFATLVLYPLLVWEISKDRVRLGSAVILCFLSYASCLLGATMYSRSFDDFFKIRLERRELSPDKKDVGTMREGARDGT